LSKKEEATRLAREQEHKEQLRFLQESEKGRLRVEKENEEEELLQQEIEKIRQDVESVESCERNFRVSAIKAKKDRQFFVDQVREERAERLRKERAERERKRVEERTQRVEALAVAIAMEQREPVIVDLSSTDDEEDEDNDFADEPIILDNVNVVVAGDAHITKEELLQDAPEDICVKCHERAEWYVAHPCDCIAPICKYCLLKTQPVIWVHTIMG
jgi:hypothetical protein